MALTANVSSQFTIFCTSGAAETQTIAIERSLRVVGVRAYGTAGTGNLQITNGSADIVPAAATVNGSWKDMVLTQANCNLTEAQSLVVITSANSADTILIDCVATAGGESLTVS
jgi:hypothetical protein